MKKFSYSLIALVALGLSSCGNKTASEASEATESLYGNDTTIVVDTLAIPAEEGENATEGVASESNADIDKFLDDYEAVLKEYDKLMTELQKGNVDLGSAMSFAEKAQSLQSNLEEMEPRMTPAQLKRLSKLVSRYASIAAKAANVNPANVQSVSGMNLKDLGL